MNVDASVRMALVAGVSPDRLVLGLPFYGHAYGGVPARNGGLFQPVGTGAPASWGGADGIDYRDLVARRPTRHGFVLRRDPDARVPWLYNPHSGIWISYDDPASIEAKCVYVRSHGLAGVMIWHIGADDGSLLRAALVGLAPPASPRVR
jgi:chitinase